MSTTWGAGCRLRLRRGIVVAPADADRWQVRWDFDEITFLEGEACGRVLPWLLPALDGIRTLAELENLARHRSSLPELRAVLDCLQQNSCLAVDDGTLESAKSEVAASLEISVLDAGAARARMHSLKPIVCGSSPLANSILCSLTAMEFESRELVGSVDEFFASLSASTCGFTGKSFERVIDRSVGWLSRADRSALESQPTDDPTLLPIVIEQDWRPQDLDRINAHMLEQRLSWMLVGAWNRRVLVGPILIPGETACYACYRRRLASHRRHQEAFEALDRWQRTVAEPFAPSPILPAVVGLTAAWTALEVFRYATGAGVPRTLGRVLVYFPDEARLMIEPVLRVPWCPSCSSILSSGPQ